MNNIFNTPFEVSLRILIILNTVKNRVSIERITALDFISHMEKILVCQNTTYTEIIAFDLVNIH